MGVNVVFPQASEVVAAARDQAAAGTSNVILAGVARLVAHHGEQWTAELVSRDPAADDGDVARSKRRIDALNMVRSELVDAIDRWVADHVAMSPDTPLHTETLGSVVDRLAIAWVRAQRLAADGSPSTESGRARRALEQWVQLVQAYEDLVVEVVAGQRRLPSWRTLKSYREYAA